MYSRRDWSGSLLVHLDVTTFDPATGEVKQVSAQRETVLQTRRGLGALAWVDTYDIPKGTHNFEYYSTDPLTNQISTQLEAYTTTQVAPSLGQNEVQVHHYEHNTGRLLSTSNSASAGPFEVSLYDRGGNQYQRGSVMMNVVTPYTVAGVGNAPAPLRDDAAMYYGADDKLRVADRRSCLHFPNGQGTYVCDTVRMPAYERRSAFEEYRYDALGRRVLVRTRSEHVCQGNCLNTLRRIVWDGDQVLYEISAPGGSTATAAQMEADTGLAVPFFQNAQHTSVAGFFPYGRMMYEHGGGIDAPLGVVRMDYSSELRGPQVIVPHASWRGSYDRGTTINGSCITYSSNGSQVAPPPDSTPSSGDQYGGVVGGGTYGGTKTHCVEVDWPASYTWSALQYRRGYSGPSAWMGSLIFESRDASGLYYRRNRYYDSEKGRFTQEDPIGLAGGLNAYGFAEGDPLAFSDPYGLSACCQDNPNQRQLALEVEAMEYNGTHPKETAALAGLGALAFAGGVGILELGAVSAAAAPEFAEGASLAERAREVHSAVSAATQRRTTISVARTVTAEGRRETWVASSERVLRPAQRMLLRAGERAISGVGHAEQTIVNAARQTGATVEEIAASRPICSICANAIRSIGARVGSVLK
jgi:RHS repeat-associated protein